MVAVVCDDLLRFYVVNKVYNVLPTLNQFLDTRYAIRLREFGCTIANEKEIPYELWFRKKTKMKRFGGK